MKVEEINRGLVAMLAIIGTFMGLFAFLIFGKVK